MLLAPIHVLPDLGLNGTVELAYGHGDVIAKAKFMAKAMILEKVKAKALLLAREMSLAKASDSG